MDQEKFGKFIKEIRKKNNLTQKQLADKYNVTYRYLDTVYEIEVVKSKKESVVVDRKTQVDGFVKLENDGKVHKVVVHTR